MSPPIIFLGTLQHLYWIGKLNLPHLPEIHSRLKKKIVIYPKHSPISINSFHLFSCVRLCATPGTAAHQDSLSITNFQSLLKFKSIESSMPSKHLILSYTLLIGLHSFLASGSFPMRQFFASGGQSTGVAASVSVLLVNNQD